MHSLYSPDSSQICSKPNNAQAKQSRASLDLPHTDLGTNRKRFNQWPDLELDAALLPFFLEVEAEARKRQEQSSKQSKSQSRRILSTCPVRRVVVDDRVYVILWAVHVHVFSFYSSTSLMVS